MVACSDATGGTGTQGASSGTASVDASGGVAATTGGVTTTRPEGSGSEGQGSTAAVDGTAGDTVEPTTGDGSSSDSGYPMPVPECDPPAWYPDSSGTVVAIPAQAGAATLDAVVPKPTPFNRPVSGHIGAWNGGVLLHREGLPYIATHGGGHGDYAGNEISIFGPLCGDDAADTPAWQVLWGPTPEAEVAADQAWNLDGNPNISHTRDTMAVLGGSFFRLWQSGRYPGVSGHRDTMRFDLASLQWDAEGSHPDVASGGSGGIRGAVVADQSRGVLWVVHDGNSSLVSYDPVAQQYTEHASSYTTSIEVTATLDPTRDHLLVWDGRDNPRWLRFDLADPDAPPVTEGFDGSFPPYKSGLEFDVARDRYVALSDADNLGVVHEMDPETLTWTERSFVGDVPPPNNTQGHFGRFRYVPTMLGYIFVPSATGPVYFFRS